MLIGIVKALGQYDVDGLFDGEKYVANGMTENHANYQLHLGGIAKIHYE